MPFMYILECSDGSFYTGSTVNLKRRLLEHNSGFGANHTKKRLPVKLMYFEEYRRVDDAFYREKQVQRWSRKKKIALINGENNILPVLAKKVFRPGASIRSPSAITQPPACREARSLSSPQDVSKGAAAQSSEQV